MFLIKLLQKIPKLFKYGKLIHLALDTYKFFIREADKRGINLGSEHQKIVSDVEETINKEFKQDLAQFNQEIKQNENV